MKYTFKDLATMQAWPLSRKIQVTQTRILEWYQHFQGKVFVSFSGGLDSTVLLDLARRVSPDIEAVFNNTGLEFPEIINFVKTIENVTITKPEMTYKSVIEKYGYPVISKEQANFIHRMRSNSACKSAFDAKLYEDIDWLRANFDKVPFSFFKCLFGLSHEREKDFIENGLLPSSRYCISRKWWYLIDAPFEIHDECCNHLKKKPLKKYSKDTGKFAIVGTTTDESLMRKQIWLKQGCNAFDAAEPKSTPLSFWTHQDVLRYILLTKIPYCSVYGEIKENEHGELFTTGYERTGCVGCLFGCHLEREPNRLQKLKVTHPQIYHYLFTKLGYKEVCDYIGIKY